MLEKELTPTEWLLIQTLRNYRRAYPNGSIMLKMEINELLDELMDNQYNETEDKEQNED